MNKRTICTAKRLTLIVGASFLPILAGCISSGPGYRETRVQAGVVLEDDYVYYPDYEVYYSRTRHSYVYRDGRRWVTRPAPPRVGIDVLVASPSIHLDFHDAPERHHADVIKRYPRNWKPENREHEVRKDDRDNDRRDDNEHRKNDHADDRKHD